MEIEIKVKIENPGPLKKLLEREGTLKYTDKQVDEYYTPAHRNFVAKEPIEEWLRLRDSNGKFSINYKRWHFDAEGKSDHCDEHETKLESIEMAREILKAIDCKPLITVNKVRSAWDYKDYEISFDEVEELGSFVEIEYIGDTANVNPKEITNKMMEFLNDLGCGQIDRTFKGYPHQLLYKHGLLKK